METKMSALYKNFATDANTEIVGFWFTIDRNDDDTEVKFLLARKSKRNKKYSELLTELLTPYQKQIELEIISPNQLQKIFMEAFIGGLLKGWKNVLDKDGNALEYNATNARKLLTDLPDLYDTLDKQTEKVSNFHTTDVEAVVKN